MPVLAFVTTTLKLSITALAGLVPCAEMGISITLRCLSPFGMVSTHGKQPGVYSPCAPLLGCWDVAAKPVILLSQASSSWLFSGSPSTGQPVQKDVWMLNSISSQVIICAGRIQFHCAAAETDHGCVQAQVLVLQVFDITQHLAFAGCVLKQDVVKRYSDVRVKICRNIIQETVCIKIGHGCITCWWNRQIRGMSSISFCGWFHPVPCRYVYRRNNGSWCFVLPRSFNLRQHLSPVFSVFKIIFILVEAQFIQLITHWLPAGLPVWRCFSVRRHRGTPHTLYSYLPANACAVQILLVAFRGGYAAQCLFAAPCANSGCPAHQCLRQWYGRAYCVLNSSLGGVRRMRTAKIPSAHPNAAPPMAIGTQFSWRSQQGEG